MKYDYKATVDSKGEVIIVITCDGKKDVVIDGMAAQAFLCTMTHSTESHLSVWYNVYKGD